MDSNWPALIACLIAAAAFADEPCEPFRLSPPDAVPATDFGGQVAVDGDFWFVSDTNARVLCGGDPFNCSAGAVHVYEMVGGVLEFRQMLTSPTPRLGDAFGRSIDAQDGRLIIGSMNSSWPGLESKGGGYVYEYDGAQWVSTAELLPPPHIDRFYSDRLGGFAAIDGDSIFLRPENREYVFSYAVRAGVWQFLEMIECPDMLPRQAGFGVHVEARDGWVFMPAYQDHSLVRFGGSVYAYRRQPDGSLEFVQKIVPTEAPGGPERALGFGSAVAFDGRTLAIGVYGADRGATNTGAVMLYELVDGVWTYQQEVTHEPAAELDLLGEMVEVSGDVLIAMARGQSSAEASSAVHLFRRGTDGVWRHDAQLVPNPPDFSLYYGAAAATDGRYALAGAADDVDPSGLRIGAAYLFDFGCGECAVDLDADGALTVFDILTFLNLFQDADPLADFDGDGELTIFDFLAFQTAFDAGCE